MAYTVQVMHARAHLFFLTGPRGPGKKSKAFNERGVAVSCHRLGDPTSF